MTSLGDYLEEVQAGFACGSEDPDGIFQFRMNNVSKSCQVVLDKRRHIPRDSHKKMDHFGVRAGDVLFNSTNSPDGVGKSILAPALDEPAVFSNHFLRLRSRPDRLDPAYLWRWLQFHYQRGTFRGMCRQWVNQATVGREEFLGLEMRPPAVTEQWRVVNILDQVESVISHRHAVLSRSDDLARSIFEEMFSHESDYRTVDELSEFLRTGPFGSQLLHSEFVDSGVAVLGIDNVVTNEFRWMERRYITPEKYDQLKRYTVRSGDVLITIMGTTGRCVVAPADLPVAINTKHLCAITVDKSRLDPNFLRAAFLWDRRVQAYLRKSTKGSIMDGLNMGIIRAMPVPVPALDQQQRFAARLSQVGALRESTLRAAEADGELFSSLQGRAFSGDL